MTGLGPSPRRHRGRPRRAFLYAGWRGRSDLPGRSGRRARRDRVHRRLHLRRGDRRLGRCPQEGLRERCRHAGLATGEVTSYSSGTAERSRCASRTSRRSTTGGGNLYVTDSRVGTTTGSSTGSRLAGRPRSGPRRRPASPTAAASLRRRRVARGRVARSRHRPVPIEDDGAAGRPEPVVDLSGLAPDGVALAQDGTMFVGCYRPDRIYRIPLRVPPKCSPTTPTASS